MSMLLIIVNKDMLDYLGNHNFPTRRSDKYVFVCNYPTLPLLAKCETTPRPLANTLTIMLI